MTSDSNQAKKKHLFLVDGYGFLFRAYHSLPPLTTPDGTPAGAIYGVCNMFMKLKNKIAHNNKNEQPHMLLVLDAGKDTFRNKIYSEYKANRPPAPDDLIPQFGLLREAGKALNIKIAELKGFEADDIIATYTKRAVEQGFRVTVVSTDKDLMQLIDDENVTMFDPMRDRVIGKEQVIEKFGVTPNKVLDLLSLMGDSADNIPGVPGIGPKTASELLNKFNTLEELLERAGEIPQNKRRESLIEFKDQALLSKRLAALEFNCPLDESLDNFALNDFDDDNLAEFLNKMGFKSILAKIGAKVTYKANVNANNDTDKKESKNSEIKPVKKFDSKFIEINEAKELEQKCQEILNHDSNYISVAIDYDLKTKELNNIGICGADQCLIINPREAEIAQNPDDQNDLFGTSGGEAEEVIKNDFSFTINALSELFKAAHKKIVFTSAKEFNEISGLTLPKNYDDIEVLNYLTQQVSKKELANNLIEKFCEDGLEIIAKDSENIPEIKKQNLAKTAFYQLEIVQQLKAKCFELQENNIYEHFDKPMIGLLLKMQENGIKIDKNILSQLSSEFKTELAELEAEIFKLAGEEFNIGSPKQLGEVLFDHLGIQGGKKSKSGAWATGSDKLEALAAGGHIIAEKVLEWRGFSKLISTYTDALQKAINPKTGRVHTHFNHTATTTGRLSSSEPNLQNIPIRTENGRKIRKAFVAQSKHKLIGIDYSQIELRLLAHVADIEILKQAFKEGKDIHSATAAQVFGVQLEDVTPELRRRAKTVNFGIIYGQSAFGLAKQLGISNGEGKEIIEKYFAQYPGIRKYMDETIEQARANSYVETIFGRKIFVNGINDKNGAVRQFAERAAINAPLQGSASDIIKIAMIKISEFFERKNAPAKMLLQIHDELIIEVTEANAEEIAKKCKNIMENVAHLSIPLIADANIGNHWGEVH